MSIVVSLRTRSNEYGTVIRNFGFSHNQYLFRIVIFRINSRIYPIISFIAGILDSMFSMPGDEIYLFYPGLRELYESICDALFIIHPYLFLFPTVFNYHLTVFVNPHIFHLSRVEIRVNYLKIEIFVMVMILIKKYSNRRSILLFCIKGKSPYGSLKFFQYLYCLIRERKFLCLC